jgi:hypothetical protein
MGRYLLRPQAGLADGVKVDHGVGCRGRWGRAGPADSAGPDGDDRTPNSQARSDVVAVAAEEGLGGGRDGMGAVVLCQGLMMTRRTSSIEAGQTALICTTVPVGGLDHEPVAEVDGDLCG